MPGYDINDIIGGLNPEERQQLMWDSMSGGLAQIAPLLARRDAGIGTLLAAFGAGMGGARQQALGDLESRKYRQSRIEAENARIEAQRADADRALRQQQAEDEFIKTLPPEEQRLIKLSKVAGPGVMDRLAPKPADPMDLIKTVGNDVVRIDPATGKPSLAYRAPYAPRDAPAQYETLSPEDVVKAGFRPGTVVERNKQTGNLETVQSPQSGMTVYGQDGKPIVEMGGGGGVPPGNIPLNSTVASKVQGEASGLIDQMGRVDRTASLWRPDFQKLGTRLGAAWSAGKEKLGFEPTPEEQKALTDFTYARQAAAQDFNQMIKEMAGTAMTKAEEERQLVALPNSGTGVFDGDSPTEFKAKLEGRRKDLKMALARKTYLLKNGIPHDFANNDSGGLSIEDMPRKIQERGEQLAAQFRAEGTAEDEVMAKTQAALKQEFGI